MTEAITPYQVNPKPCTISTAGVKLARRIEALIATNGEMLHTIQITAIDGVWVMWVNDGKMERIGKLDTVT